MMLGSIAGLSDALDDLIIADLVLLRTARRGRRTGAVGPPVNGVFVPELGVAVRWAAR